MLGSDFIASTVDCMKKQGTFVEIDKHVWSAEQHQEYRADTRYFLFDIVLMWETDRPLIRKLLEDIVPHLASNDIAPLPHSVFKWQEAHRGWR